MGSYPDYASPYGALDMAGNLWEWVSDVYPGIPDHILKGGDWETLVWGVRSAVRGGDWEAKGKLLWGGAWNYWDYCIKNWGVSYCTIRDGQVILGNGIRCVLSP